jgi:glucokinase
VITPACKLPGKNSAGQSAQTCQNALGMAFAGPAGGEVLKLTNNPWVIRRH